MENLTPKLNEVQLKQNIDALVSQKAPREVVQSYINNYASDGAGGFVLKNAIQQQKVERQEQGLPVSVREDRAEPTLAGSIVRGIAAAPVKAALSIPAAVRGEKGVTVQSKYLGETSDLAKTIRDNAEMLAERVNAGEITLPGALLRQTGQAALETLDVAGLAPTGAGVSIAGKVGRKGLATAGTKIATGAKAAGTTVGEIVEKAPNALAKFVSPDVDPKFATSLKRTTKAEVDEMETVVKNAVENADNPSAFEFVGNKLADATEQVANQVKSLSQQKKAVISQAKNGLTDFTKETGQTILDISRTVKNSKLAQSFITRLKQVKTKLDADNAIDELQDILYKGNKDMTIPVGSKEDILLKGLLGKYNTTLKNTLPASYRKLNDAISNKLDNLELLNKSLGEVVEGVPIRGASLIKQYFSPSGTKAKELFEFIRKNTGYDVGKDAVLAKYMSEIYGETRAKSLLQGLPTTAQGTLDKLLDFTLQKTGVTERVSRLSRKGQVLKAKSIAK